MLSLSKMASKVILITALTATDVALERILIAVAAHVDGVEDVVCKVGLAVLAAVKQLRVLWWQARDRCARHAVANAS